MYQYWFNSSSNVIQHGYILYKALSPASLNANAILIIMIIIWKQDAFKMNK